MAFYKLQLAVAVVLSVILLSESAPVELSLKPVVRGDDKWCPGMPYAVGSGDDCEESIVKYQELERKRQEEESKRITEERAKTAEGSSKEIEEAVKNLDDGKRGLPSGPVNKMNDVDLYLTASKGKGIGKCKINYHPEEIKTCYMYVKGRVSDVHGDYGFPKQTLPDGSKSGSGCVEQKDGPKGHDGMCRYAMSSYGFTEDEQWRICSDYGAFNALNMLKMAMKKGQC